MGTAARDRADVELHRHVLGIGRHADVAGHALDHRHRGAAQRRDEAELVDGEFKRAWQTATVLFAILDLVAAVGLLLFETILSS